MKKNPYRQKTEEEIKKEKEEHEQTLAGIRKMHGQTMRKVRKMASGEILFNDRGQ